MHSLANAWQVLEYKKNQQFVYSYHVIQDLSDNELGRQRSSAVAIQQLLGANTWLQTLKLAGCLDARQHSKCSLFVEFVIRVKKMHAKIFPIVSSTEVGRCW